MKRLLLFALLVAALVFVAGTGKGTSPFCEGALLAQSHGDKPAPPMPPEGNPGHKPPPKGAWCDHTARPEHHCECHAQCVENDDGTTQIVEDGVHCRAWCFKAACRCPADNCQAPTKRP